MSNLVAIAYPDVDTARTVAEELAELTKEQSIDARRHGGRRAHPEGKVQLHQSRSTTGRGAAGGAVWGMMIGFIFFAPFLGAAIGGATGAAVGKQKDEGVEDDFMDRLGVQLSNGGAAVVVLVRAQHAGEGAAADLAVRRHGDPDLARSRPGERAASGARRPGRGRLSCDERLQTISGRARSRASSTARSSGSRCWWCSSSTRPPTGR